MTSIVDICNMALSEAGNRAQMITSLDEPSEEANQCRLWYDTMRKRLLRTAPWGFARATEYLTQLGDLIPGQTSPYPWLFKYAYPSDCSRMRYILPPPPPLSLDGGIAPPVTGAPVLGPTWLGPQRQYRFLPASEVTAEGHQSTVLIANVKNAIAVYTREITDPDRFDELFIGALASAIAYKIVTPLSGNVGARQEMKQAAMDAITVARAADGNEAIPTTDHEVDWVTTRGVGSTYGYGPWGGSSNPGWGMYYAGYDNMTWGS